MYNITHNSVVTVTCYTCECYTCELCTNQLTRTTLVLSKDPKTELSI